MALNKEFTTDEERFEFIKKKYKLTTQEQVEDKIEKVMYILLTDRDNAIGFLVETVYE